MAVDRRSDAELAIALAESQKYLRTSYSSMGTFAGCMRKGEFSKLYPQRPRMFESYPADVGTALHKGYQQYLVNQNETQAFWAFAEAFPYELEYQEKNDFRSLEACVSTLEEMIESTALGEYELAKIKRPLNDEDRAELNRAAIEGRLLDFDETGRIVPAIEVPFEIRFKGITLPDGRGVAFVGFMDAIMRNLITGAHRTMDIKTHRRTKDDATSVYIYNAQQLPYGIAIQHIDNQPVDEFEVLYLDCYIDLLRPRVTPYIFKKDADDVQEWLMNTVLQVQAIQRAMEMDYFPRTGTGCMNWNQPCYFLEVCQSRDKASIIDFMLMGSEPAVPRYEVPWIVAEIDVFGSEG